MYPPRIHQAIVLPQHNLQKLLGENGKFAKYSIIIRQKFSQFRDVGLFQRKLRLIFRNGAFCKMLQNTLELPQATRKNSNNILRVWVHQCECVFAQRLRRCQQMFCQYSKWWEERAFKELLKKMRVTIQRSGKEFVLGGIGISSLYNWEEYRIPDEEMEKQMNELDYVSVLKENTFCLECQDHKQSTHNTRVCKCGTPAKLPTKTYDDWTPFIEQDDLVVWRKPKSPGLFEYKVYGNYNDVSAEDFLNVQIDTNYRKSWDTTAVMLEIAEKDPETNSDILYWEMLWPRLFANRDYVFNRRYLVDRESKTIVIVNKTTEHPSFPHYTEKYRVEEYWSCMVIKPYSDLREPGLEFSLTYYDNPGLNIPSSVMTWVSMKAMPDYLVRLREATRKYKEYCINEGVTEACEPIREEARRRREQEEKDKLDYCSFERIRTRIEERFKKLEEQFPQRGGRGRDDGRAGKVAINAETSVQDTPTTPSITAMQKETRSYWKYLHPFYYFH